MHWAEQYLGRPWENGASGPGAFDCFGLVIAIYRDRYGIDLPRVNVDAHKPMAVRHAISGYQDLSNWAPVDLDELQEGDVIEMSQAKHPHHVGVYLNAGGILHSVEGAGVIYQSFQRAKLHGWNIVCAYRRNP